MLLCNCMSSFMSSCQQHLWMSQADQYIGPLPAGTYLPAYLDLHPYPTPQLGPRRIHQASRQIPDLHAGAVPCQPCGPRALPWRAHHCPPPPQGYISQVLTHLRCFVNTPCTRPNTHPSNNLSSTPLSTPRRAPRPAVGLGMLSTLMPVIGAAAAA